MTALLPPASLTQRISLRCQQCIEPLPLQYTDSANWLWRGSQSIFKLARHDPSHNHFWNGADQLFSLERFRCGERLGSMLSFLPHGLPIQMMPMQWRGVMDGAPLWEQQWIEGSPLYWSHASAKRLGQFCCHLQRRRSAHIGPLYRPSITAKQWSHHVWQLLKEQNNPELHMALSQAGAEEVSLQVNSCVPLLLDLRLDQFIVSNEVTFCIDWEALVWAPIEFAWALYEVLIPTDYRESFLSGLEGAQQPDISAQRLYYRAILFSMGAFGHVHWHEMESIDPWLSRA